MRPLISTPATLGEYLKLQRRQQHLSLRELERHVGLSRVTLAHIEAGTYDVKLSQLEALAEALHLPLVMLHAYALLRATCGQGQRQPPLQELLATLESTTRQLREAMAPKRRPRRGGKR
jgi:transcriptional regulator with XRE-family HTH domain